MLTTFCESFECPSGECEGCKLGKLWCGDPSCYPYCRGCDLPRHHNTVINIIMLFMIVILTMIVIVLFLSYGPKLARFHNGNLYENFEYTSSFEN